MKKVACLCVWVVISAAAVWAKPVGPGEWDRIRRYGHGFARNDFTDAQFEYIDENLYFLTLEKMHGTYAYERPCIELATANTAARLKNTKVLLYLQAYYAFDFWETVAEAKVTNPEYFTETDGQNDLCFNFGNPDALDWWASVSDNLVNTTQVAGTFVDAIGKISLHGHSDWLPALYEKIPQMDGITICNGGVFHFPYADGGMKEDYMEGTVDDIRTYLDRILIEATDDKYLMLNSFHEDYKYALACFLIVAHDKSFFRYYDLANESHSQRWGDVLWHCEEYDKRLGPPKGKGVRVSDWVYERSFEYADVRVNLENGTSSMTWHETPVVTDSRPIAHDDSVIVDEDASVAIILSGSDADGNTSTPLTYRVGVQPANGTLSGTAPDLTYTPDVNCYGSDRFYFLVNNGEANSYAAEVSITVNPLPDVPVATAQSIIVYKDEPSVITLSGTDADGDILTYALESQPVNGWLSGTAPSLTYTPDAGYVGVDGFAFTVNDGLYNSVPATVSIWVSQDVTDVIAAYDFDDGVGNATTAVSLKDANVSASDYGVGVGLNNVINTSSGLAEDKDAEGNNFGTANPLSYGGIRDDFGFTRQGSLSGAITTDEYMTFTVTPTNSASMNLSRFTFRHFANNLTESATSWALYSSVGGFDQADAIATGETTVAADWVGHVIDLPAKSFRGLNQAVEFRLYIYDGRNNSNSLTLFDKVILHGSVAN